MEIIFILRKPKLKYLFNNFLSTVITTGTVAYCLVPLGKFVYLEPSDPMDLLIFPCWTPLPMDTNWGFYSTYFCQLLIILIANLALARVFCYKIICLLTIGHQIRLIGLAISTIEQRVIQVMREKTISEVKVNNNIHFILEQEIKKCAMQFQNVYRYKKSLLFF